MTALDAHPKPPPHYEQLAEALDAELIPFCGGSVCFVSETFLPGYRHGAVEFQPPEKAQLLPMAPFSIKVDTDQVGFESLLFFDTETTGLGGSGAVAFLIGVGSVTESGFEVRQYLIPDFGDESAMLELLLDEFSADKTLVSFNGKSFDLPLLESRMIINRAARKVAHKHHIDILHASRRLFKRRLKDCTLVNLEEKLFGFQREDDIPGFLIPATYFDWIHDREIGELKNVMQHNRLDILSLYFILTLLADSYNQQGENLDAVADLYSLSRLFGRQKLTQKAHGICHRIELESNGHEQEISFYNSLMFKRGGDTPRAVRIWTDLSTSDTRVSIKACIELSKYLEHNQRDFPEALRMAERAFRLSEANCGRTKEIEHRLARLRKKMAK
ncbi:MAG: ribonuclease H-like domain-containing protein [bacterium]|nr:ribonuclease H-like domain-containing protein [bacterium]